ncbi:MULTISPECIES: hypothetical protein [unclassified Lactobacillus]|uniref:hypothetical protein n=1 Tax=unclassified Lactobacillus TaxID=2620435 RepID=UPI000EFA3B29|nr:MULTISPECIES: hypothetical protein [unclassified Lactobacillus]RMC24411.1 hypothetical protein F5ESL0247_04360 [Lactobacillus sp. ESL0247]RMC28550.1 hypothetical protein F5ESL0246_04360 [Lactobacillus sp. ESL0246]RMC31741.1 hypothetical protein F5ESL0245_04365 [Lactobacillus sp. ESL0245]
MLVNGKEVGHLILNGEIFDKKILDRKINVTKDTLIYRLGVRSFSGEGVSGGETYFEKMIGRPDSKQICKITGLLPTKEGDFALLDYITVDQGMHVQIIYKNQIGIKVSDLNYV